ncbi:MAG: nucleoside triphosphate pyrophosphohydrolase [Acidobacteria bacterium]|nr:nucleoside triphosphate pyrophosphohydrolase [Acidobacteriota bacterium]
MARLREPGGCPWDREQTRETLKPMLVEESYEVLHALDASDSRELREELGDLLLQIVFHARIAEENGEFDMQGVIDGIHDKIIHRHPHVFGDVKVSGSDEVLVNWDRIKKEEKARKGSKRASILDGIPPKMPALHEAHQIGARAARAGFDWEDAGGVIRKIREELDELERSLSAENPAAVREEIGDLLFAVVNLCRFLSLDPETALKTTNQKFRQRFGFVEKKVREAGKTVEDCDLDELERYWQESKQWPN